MAATRLIAMYMNKGKTIQKCLKDRTDYAQNGEKTNGGELVSSYECDPKAVEEQFALAKREYTYKTGRYYAGGIIAYQIRQSFKPGEVTPEEANRIGYETAMCWTKGRHSFIVATHNDKAHIHNHIVYNSTDLECKRKFKNVFFSGVALQKVSDMVCLENGLSVIEPKKPGERARRTEYPDRKSFREEIREAIDVCMDRKPRDMDELLKYLEEMGYEIKRRKYISLKGGNHKKLLRLRSLGEGYRDEDLERFFSKDTEYAANTKQEKSEDPVSEKNEEKLLMKVKKCLDDGAQAIILSDYGKGVCTAELCSEVISLGKEYGVPVIVDPKGTDWSRYRGADYITPNLKELNEVQKEPAENEDEAVVRAARYALRRFHIGAMVATRSECGLSMVRSRSVVHIPTKAQEVFDVSGAGDTVIATFAMALAGGLDPASGAYLANLAAGVVVGKLGTYAVSRDELLNALQTEK